MSDYDIDSRVIEKLISIETKILESYQHLFAFKDVDNEAAKFQLEKLKMLIKKENVLLNQLPKNSSFLTYIVDLVVQNSANFFNDVDVATEVLIRFTNVLEDLAGILFEKEEAELLEEVDIDIDDVDKASVRINIRDNLLIKYIKSLETLIFSSSDELKEVLKNCQYAEAFYNKTVGDFLLEKDFETKNITFRDDYQMIDILGLSIDDYVSLKNEEILYMVQSVFVDLTSNSLGTQTERSDLRKAYDSLKFKFLLKEMPTPILIYFDERINEEINELSEKNSLVDDLCVFVKRELKTRKDIPEEVAEPNPLRTPIDEQTIDSLIELIKLDEKILLLFDNIDFDDLDNSIDIKNLSRLVSAEKELVDKIDINYRNAKIIEEMFLEDLDFFLIEEEESRQIRKKQLIYERIHDLLPFYQKLELSPIQSQGSYSCISQNHLVSSLKSYEKVIDETEDEERKNYLKEFYRELFYVNVRLMDDFIFANGNYKMIDRFDDELSSRSIGLSDIEYAFDKDEQLYEHAKLLIEEVLSYEDSWEKDLDVWAAFEFKLLELDDIIKNVSDEHFYELPYLVSENNTYKSTNSKKRILKLLKNYE
ncbi:MAG: hypothetical protein IKG27_01910 [Bacilli bacterium]|nr:hypothetical protein [Bacilli bacterium]